jgi:hypothetical protein
MSTNSVGGAMATFLGVAYDLKKTTGTNSLVDITSVARVEPITLIDSDCVHLDYAPDIMQSLLSIFTGYYMQAVSLLTKVGNVSVIKKLGPLNPNNNIQDNINVAYLSFESYQYKLPGLHTKSSLALENAFNGSDEEHVKELMREKMREDKFKMGYDKHNKEFSEFYRKATPEELRKAEMDNEKFHMDSERHSKDKQKFVNGSASLDSREVADTVKELVNLSVGKMFNVTIEEMGNKAVIPVSVRLMVNHITKSSIVDMMTFKKGYDMNLKERYHSWRAGRLEFIKDLIFCRDLVDKHRKQLLKDTSGVYQQIMSRDTSNKLAGLLSKATGGIYGTSTSLATASNIAVLSTDTIAAIEDVLGTKFKELKTRNAVFDSTNLMLMAVVDKQWEKITLYTRGISESTTISVRDMKAGNKGEGGNVGDFMKAYLAGSNPSI